MSTHTTIRTAIAAVVAGLTVGGIVLTVSRSGDAADMYATEKLGRHVCILIEDAPGDGQRGPRQVDVVLSAARMRGLDEPTARASLSTLAGALRTAMLAQGVLGSIGTQVIAAQSETIRREGDVIVLRQTYQLQAPA